jgi:hypothetical protein
MFVVKSAFLAVISDTVELLLFCALKLQNIQENTCKEGFEVPRTFAYDIFTWCDRGDYSSVLFRVTNFRIVGLYAPQ